MAGFNLPPGVGVFDIPGNRPEDEAEEKFWQVFEEKLDEAKVKVPQELWDDEVFVQACTIARDLGFDRGYADGETDAALEVLAKQAQEDSES